MNNEELKEQLKQEYRKKLFIVLGIICTLIMVCIIVTNISNRNNSSNNSANNENNDKTISFKTVEDIIEYLDQFKTEKVELTTENWKEYVTIEDRTIEKKDQFGEITSIVKGSFVKLKDNICGYATLRFEAVNSNNYWVGNQKGGNSTTTIYGGQSLSSWVGNSNIDIWKTDDNINNFERDITFTIEDLKCTKAKGYVYTINIPEELWQKDEKGEQYIPCYGDIFYKEDIIRILSGNDCQSQNNNE